MFATFLSLSLLLALARSVLAQSDFMIDTPSLVQCRAANITWTSTSSPPYDLLVVSANDECGPAIEDLGNQTSTSLNWTVNVAAGTSVVLSLMDAAGEEAWSGAITVGASNDNSCLTSNPPSTPATTPTVPATRQVLAFRLLSVPDSLSCSSSYSHTHSTTPMTTFVPAAAAGAGVVNNSGALSTCPLSVLTLLWSAALAVITFTL